MLRLALKPLRNLTMWKGLVGARCYSARGVTVNSDILIEWEGIWWNAKVKETDSNKNQLLISYENWSSKWDEWVDCVSPRLKHSDTFSIVSSNVSTSSSPVTPVLKMLINGKEYLSAELFNGRTLLMDPESGVLSWTAAPAIAAPTSDWVERTDAATGVVYYFNPLTKKAQFEAPTLSPERVAENMQKTDLKTLDTVYYNKDGIPYYQNVESGTVSWEPTPPTHTFEESVPDAEDTVKDAKKDTKKVSQKPPREELKSCSREIQGKLFVEPPTVPEGWEMYFTESGVAYYYCCSTGVSHWTLPQQEDPVWWIDNEPKQATSNGAKETLKNSSNKSKKITSPKAKTPKSKKSSPKVKPEIKPQTVHA